MINDKRPGEEHLWPSNVTDISDYRPHLAGEVRCKCGHKWVGVWPEVTPSLECPGCGEMTPAPTYKDWVKHEY